MGCMSRNCEHTECIANLEGLCSVQNCRGPLRSTAHKEEPLTWEQAETLYNVAAAMFQDAFGDSSVGTDAKK